MDRSSIRAQVQRLMDDPDGIIHTNTIVNDWIDLALVDAMARLGTDISVQTISIVGNDTFSSSSPNYQLDDSTDHIREVYLANEQDQEQRIMVYDQDELNVIVGPGWRATTEVGVPTLGYRVDRNVLGLHQRPNLAHNGNTLRVFYGRAAASLGSDSSIPALMKANHLALAFFCCRLAWMRIGKNEIANDFFKQYKELILGNQNKEQRFSNDMNRMRWG